MVGLTTLWLYGNQITSIEGLSGLVNLKTLHLYGNHITSIEGLSERVNLPDPEYDCIMEESLEKNIYPIEKIEKANSKKNNCLATKFCTQKIWDKYKNTKSSGPAQWTLARAINTGVTYPSSFVGCHAGDKESYDDFKDFFYPIIEAYHKGFKISEAKNSNNLISNNFNPDMIKVDLSNSAQSKIISTRIRIARNLSMFPLNPGGTKETRLEIAQLMEKVYNEINDKDISGNFLQHTKMTNDQRVDLIDNHFLFKGKDKMQAASGYHSHWPHGRGIFLNKNKTFLNWVNEGDHIRIISMEKGGDIKAVFSRLAKGAKLIEDGIRKQTGIGNNENVFMMHEKLGAVTCCPSNLGTGMRGSVHLRLPKLIEKMGLNEIDKIARLHNCQARGSNGEHSEIMDYIDISNWRRIGCTEAELISDMIKFVNYLSDEEDILG